jgi:hypothetical protein
MIKRTLKALGISFFIAAPLLGFGQENLIEYPSGEVYSGETINMQPNGTGRMIYPWGAIYEGSWKEGRKNGKGKQAHADGRVYIGEWENGGYLGNTFNKNPGDRLVREAKSLESVKELQAIAELEKQERALEVARIEKERALEAARVRQEEAARIAQENGRFKNGDFSAVESCNDFFSFGYVKKDYSDFIFTLNGAQIRPNGELHASRVVLENFSEDTLTVRNDFGLILIDITDSPMWFNESTTSVGSGLTIIGFYEANVETLLTSGVAAQLPRLRAKCISPIIF